MWFLSWFWIRFGFVLDSFWIVFGSEIIVIYTRYYIEVYAIYLFRYSDMLAQISEYRMTDKWETRPNQNQIKTDSKGKIE